MMRVILTLLLLISLRPQPAHAQLGNICKWFPNSEVPNASFPSSDAVIDIWISTYYSSWTNKDRRVTTATGLSINVVANGVSRAIANWNEQSGSLIWLRYAGLTSAQSKAGAIVLVGVTEICGSSIANTGPSFINGVWNGAVIDFRRFAGTSPSCFNTPLPWTTTLTPGFNTDFVIVLEHEIGHAIFNLVHPGDAGCEYVSQGGVVPNGTRTVMEGNGPSSFRPLSNFDKEMAQARYLPRANFSRIWKARRSASWVASAISSAVQLRPAYRMGSVSSTVTPRVVPWQYGPINAPSAGGRSQLSVAQYQTGMNTNSWGLSNIGRPLSHPPAVAARNVLFAQAELLMAYLGSVTTAPSALYTFNYGALCYRRSLDGGLTWQGEVCTGIYSNGYGVTATYDYYSNSFLVGIVTQANWKTGVVRIPVSGDAGSLVVSEFNNITEYPPSVACSNANFSGDCLAAFGSASGGFSWLKFIVASSGVATVQSGPYGGSVAIPFDTPSVVFNPTDQTYHAAVTQAGSAVYSYSMPWNGTAWTGTGDMYNNPSAHISTAVLAHRTPSGSLGGLYGWFVKFNQ